MALSPGAWQASESKIYKGLTYDELGQHWEDKITVLKLWPQTVKLRNLVSSFSTDKTVFLLQKNSHLDSGVASHYEDRPSAFRRKWLHQLMFTSCHVRYISLLELSRDKTCLTAQNPSSGVIAIEERSVVLSHCFVPNFQNQRQSGLSLLSSPLSR